MKCTQTAGQEYYNRQYCDKQSDPATYCQRRFEGSRRMRRLNRLELDFAHLTMQLVGKESSVLDVPCGNGRFLEVFSKARQLTMLDLSPSMLKTLRDKFQGAFSLNILEGDIAELPFEDNSFDLCFCMRLFQHIGDDQLRRWILAQLARVSRRYVATSFYKTHSVRYLKRVIRGKKPSGCSISSAKFIATAADVGLKLLRKVPSISFVEQQQMVLFEKK